MTEKDRIAIRELRASGISYSKIADILSMSVSAIKSYCVRNKLSAKVNKPSCLMCNKPIEELSGGREKKFCSDSCRIKWWNHHTNLMKANSVCVHCGKSFHGRKGRKYCSHACYIAKRFGDKNAS